MDAFNDILTVEHEAEQAINTAKDEAEVSIINTRSECKAQLEAESVKLQEAEQAALAAHQSRVDKLIEKIKSDVNIQVVAVDKLFSSQKANLKSAIKQSF